MEWYLILLNLLYWPLAFGLGIIAGLTIHEIVSGQWMSPKHTINRYPMEFVTFLILQAFVSVLYNMAYGISLVQVSWLVVGFIAVWLIYYFALGFRFKLFFSNKTSQI